VANSAARTCAGGSGHAASPGRTHTPATSESPTADLAWSAANSQHVATITIKKAMARELNAMGRPDSPTGEAGANPVETTKAVTAKMLITVTARTPGQTRPVGWSAGRPTAGLTPTMPTVCSSTAGRKADQTEVTRCRRFRDAHNVSVNNTERSP
jgi:hypothetical protein